MFESLNGETALYWSGGLDSTLLLAMLIEEQKRFDIVQFRNHWTRTQRKRVDAVIKQHNLKVFGYAPAAVNLIGDGDQISVVREYAVDGGVIPLISDVIDGTKCIDDLSERSYSMPLPWQTIITGSKKEDTHYARETVVCAERWTVGKTRFWAPLYSYSRQQVRDELDRRGWPSQEVSEKEDTGNLSACTKCICPSDTGLVFCPKVNKEIPVRNWDPNHNLDIFRQSYA